MSAASCWPMKERTATSPSSAAAAGGTGDASSTAQARVPARKVDEGRNLRCILWIFSAAYVESVSAITAEIYGFVALCQYSPIALHSSHHQHKGKAMNSRTERDSFGPIEVPEAQLWGA